MDITLFMVNMAWQSHCESSPVHLMNAEKRQTAANFWTKPIGSRRWSAEIDSCTVRTIHHRHLLLLSQKANILFLKIFIHQEW